MVVVVIKQYYDHWHRLVRRRLNGYSTRLTKTKVVRSPRRRQSGLAGGLLLHIKEIIHHHNISETAWWLAWRMLRLGWMLPTKTGSVSLILTAVWLLPVARKHFLPSFFPRMDLSASRSSNLLLSGQTWSTCECNRSTLSLEIIFRRIKLPVGFGDVFKFPLKIRNKITHNM